MNSLLELPAFSLLHVLQNNDCDVLGFFNTCVVNISCASKVEKGLVVAVLSTVCRYLKICSLPSGRYLESSASSNQLCFPAWFACSFGYPESEC